LTAPAPQPGAGLGAERNRTPVRLGAIDTAFPIHDRGEALTRDPRDAGAGDLNYVVFEAERIALRRVFEDDLGVMLNELDTT